MFSSSPLSGVVADVKLAVRRSVATPGYTAFAGLSIGVGLGTAIAVYSIAGALFWPKIGIENPRGAYVLAVTDASRQQTTWQSAFSNLEVAELQAAVPEGAPLAKATELFLPLATNRGPRLVQVEAIDGAYFQVLGVKSQAGRLLGPADVSESHATALVSHSLWQSEFEGPFSAGRTITLAGTRFEVIGVADPSYKGLRPPMSGRTELWIPRSSIPHAQLASKRWTAISRPDEDDLVPALTSAIAAVRRDGSGKRAEIQWTLVPLEDALWDAPAGILPYLLLSGAVVVLVIAITNLSSLSLARGSRLGAEYAARAALGASRWRLVRLHLAETILLAAAGGILSIIVASALLGVATVDIPQGNGRVSALEPVLDISSLSFGLIGLALVLLGFGLLPGLRLTHSSLRASLTLGTGVIASSWSSQTRAIRWQVAGSTCLLLIAVACGQLALSGLGRSHSVVLDGLAMATVNYAVPVNNRERTYRSVDAILAALNREPGIAAAASAGFPFGSGSTPLAAVTSPKTPGMLALGDSTAYGIPVSATFFSTLGLHVVRGRPFSDTDTAESPAVSILSRSLAARIFGSDNPVGNIVAVRFWPGPGSKTPMREFAVVGVVEDALTGNRSGDAPAIYVPLTQHYEPAITFLARAGSDRDPLTLLRSTIPQHDSELAVLSSGMGVNVAAGFYVLAKYAAVLAVTLGAVSALLVMVGLYGLLSQSIRDRTREVGLRMALGAHPEAIRRAIVWQGTKPVVVGVLVGAFLGTAVRLMIRALLPVPFAATDLWILLMACLPIILLALVASYRPGRSASLIEPATALRHL
jgi:putative ABC transport system permease protein